MDRKVIDAPEIKLSDEGNGEFVAYASTFGNWDQVQERPIKGAFEKHLPAFLNDGFIALGHDWQSLPIATPKEAYEDDRGLVIRAEFHSTTAAQDARRVLMERLQRGKSAKTSIGYTVLADEYTQEGRLLKEIKLHEVSLVTVPANPLASVLASKGGAVSALPLEAHSAMVVSAVEELKARYHANHEIRAKEGRVLSEANRKRIATLLESLTSVQQELAELLAATEPKASLAETQKLYRQHLELQRRLHALGVTA